MAALQGKGQLDELMNFSLSSYLKNLENDQCLELAAFISASHNLTIQVVAGMQFRGCKEAKLHSTKKRSYYAL